MRADYELRHKLFGQQGSLWERQVDPETRQRIRTIVIESGHSSLLSRLDQTAAGTLNEERVLTEDVFFRFADGEFAVIGNQQRDYRHQRVVLDDGSQVYVGYHSGTGSYSADPLPTQLADLTQAFLRKLAKDQDMFLADQSRDWYLVPVPVEIMPVVIQGKRAGEYLVQGVDFLAFEGYIAMIDLPTSVLPLGLVKVCSAQIRPASSNTFVLSAPDHLTRNKWVAEYTYKTQSLEACRRAAAEYAGLYVFQSADVVLAAHDVAGSINVIYIMAAAGAITITYPHVRMWPTKTVEPGDIVCQRFDLVTTLYASTEDLRKQAFEGWLAPIVMDGILPVKNLTWDGGATLALTDGGTDLETGKTHARLMFDGETADLERFWAFSALHERATGVFLHETLLEPGLPDTVDFWDLLHTFYGSQLVLVLIADHGPAINSRLYRFLFEQHPKSTNLLMSMELP
jgi:hypothetical protein